MDRDLDPDADCFKPPPGSILVHCLHCGEEYESYRIEWRIFDGPDGKHGMWCCPIEGCDGAGFGFDIFPIDADDAEQFGMMIFDDDDEDDDQEEDFNLDEEDSAANPTSNDDPAGGDDDIPF